MAIGFLKEMEQYPIDGIYLAYNRRPALVEYGAPIVEGFRARFGEDPGSIGDRDPRWLSYRATFLTEFMREVRAPMGKFYYGMDLKPGSAKAWWTRSFLILLLPASAAP